MIFTYGYLINYWGKTPQSTLIFCPVIAEAWSDAKNTHVDATSFDRGNLFNDAFCLANCLINFSGFIFDGE